MLTWRTRHPTKCICRNCKLYLSNLQIVFVQIAKCSCTIGDAQGRWRRGGYWQGGHWTGWTPHKKEDFSFRDYMLSQCHTCYRIFTKADMNEQLRTREASLLKARDLPQIAWPPNVLKWMDVLTCVDSSHLHARIVKSCVHRKSSLTRLWVVNS